MSDRDWICYGIWMKSLSELIKSWSDYYIRFFKDSILYF